MSATVTEQVDIYFDLEQTGGDVFTLDDPVKGKLDDVTYLLSGDVATDVTAYVQSVSVRRGRSRELDEIVPGSAVIELKNYDGRFMPDAFGASNDPAPYGAGNIELGKRVTVTTDGAVVFDGYIEDWVLDYEASDNSVRTSITAFDSLAQLSFKRFNAWTATSSQVAGERINDILDRAEINWGASRDLKDSAGSFQGVSSLQGDNVSYGSNALNYCQLVGRSDLGRFFASRTGVLTYRDRHHLINTDSDVLTFSDTGSGIEFTRAALTIGGELLYTDVSVDREGGTAQTSSDTDARSAFGIRRLDINGLLLDTDAQSADMADYLLGIYKQPQARIPSIDVRLQKLTGTDPAAVASLDLSSLVTVTWSPRGAQQLSADFVVEGISHNIRPDVHDVTLTLSPVQQAEVLILDNANLGKLDTGVLAF